MEAAAHTAGGYGGVPQSVGKKFAAADKAKRGRPKSKDFAGRKHVGPPKY